MRRSCYRTDQRDRRDRQRASSARPAGSTSIPGCRSSAPSSRTRTAITRGPARRAYLCAAPGERGAAAPAARTRAIETLPYGEPLAHRRRRASRSIRPATSSARRRSASSTAARSGSCRATTSAQPDPTCAPFEPVALPHVHHRSDLRAADLHLGSRRSRWSTRSLAWWRGNRDGRRPSVLFCYVLGKAQRILAELARPRRRADPPARRDVRADRRVSRRGRRDGAGRAHHRRRCAARRWRGRWCSRRCRRAARRGCGACPNASRRVRVGPDARPRRPPPARLRSRLRACRITPTGARCSTTIAETGASRVLVTHGWSEALARYLARRTRPRDRHHPHRVRRRDRRADGS